MLGICNFTRVCGATSKRALPGQRYPRWVERIRLTKTNAWNGLIVGKRDGSRSRGYHLDANRVSFCKSYMDMMQVVVILLYVLNASWFLF